MTRREGLSWEADLAAHLSTIWFLILIPFVSFISQHSLLVKLRWTDFHYEIISKLAIFVFPTESFSWDHKNKLPTSKTAIRKVETLAERYILLDSLLFTSIPEKETAVLAVPEMHADKIITLYHSSLFAGHQGVIKTYLTISDKLFVPNLIHYIRS